MQRSASRVVDGSFPNVERVNSELFTFTYGSLIRQLLTDYEDVEEVNEQLDSMGYNIGVRLIDEFLSKANITACRDFRESMDVTAKLAFKMFLGVSATATNWNPDFTECSIVFEDNPLTDFVELPDTLTTLKCSNLLCGAIRGALEQVSLKVEANFVRDVLKGDEQYEIRVKLVQVIAESYPYKDKD